MTLRAKGGRGELRFPECRSQQRTAECVKASLAATWELCELSFWGRAAIPTRGVLGPPLHLIDDPPLFPPRSWFRLSLNLSHRESLREVRVMIHQEEPLDSSEMVVETASVLDRGVKANAVSFNAVVDAACSSVIHACAT